MRQIRGNDRIDGDDEHVRPAVSFPKARNLAQSGESRRKIGAPAPRTAVESTDDSVRHLMMEP